MNKTNKRHPYIIKNENILNRQEHANQYDLQNAVEQLSEYLEHYYVDITLDNLTVLKQIVQDKFRYCDSRRRVLLNHVYEGYDKGLWKYAES
ncbi:e3 ubiquitin-protein ligase arih1 [Trichonephila clavata]|uniref:E3 ubiquitin-protein ligase arih1 n=1 Tax=Trichonephila clavata TaxID=2740835 RepID=A0A8X6HKG0_TRICU|nr:e3 ubiquitin-protein ligase arih1 [Trichonephila clavata]